MNAISNVLSGAVTEARADVHPLGAIALFCGIGLAASFCLMTFGVDLGAAWL
jgi:hypothetical protein